MEHLPVRGLTLNTAVITASSTEHPQVGSTLIVGLASQEPEQEQFTIKTNRKFTVAFGLPSLQDLGTVTELALAFHMPKSSP